MTLGYEATTSPSQPASPWEQDTPSAILPQNVSFHFAVDGGSLSVLQNMTHQCFPWVQPGLYWDDLGLFS